MFQQMTILAPGLLGGSVARAARAQSAARRIVIWARRPETRRELVGQEWCDIAAGTPEAAVKAANLVVVAAPVDAIIPLVRQIASHLPAGAIVTDVGSVKREIARQGHDALGTSAHFVGSHPMAGSEKTGWENGSATLFEHRTCFVTPLAVTDPKAAETVANFWQRLGANVVSIDPEKHDEIVAHISHLPQILASSLCAFLAGKDPMWKNYAGGGLRDTTRIAASDPKLWRTILEQNRDEVLNTLRQFQDELKSFELALENKNWDEVTAKLERGRAYRSGFPSA